MQSDGVFKAAAPEKRVSRRRTVKVSKNFLRLTVVPYICKYFNHSE